MSNLLKQKLLDFYKISESDYEKLIQDFDETNFAHGNKFEKMDEAVALVKGAMANLENIAIYGDYDADGIMGTSILVKMFKYLHYPVSYYIPSRYLDGYGLTLKYAKKAVENNIKLLITVDNGICANEPIEYLKNNGVKVLVLDHHSVPEILPVADVIIHPQFSKFSDIASSGAFTAFMFSCGLLGRFDKYLSTLAAISLISDMMPLVDYNRNFLRLVFRKYRDGEFPQIDLLKENEPFDEKSIGMKIAPKINALGRIIETDEINKIVNYFTDDSKEELLNYLKWINETNEFRKTASKEASEEIEQMPIDEDAIVVISEAKEGLLGLIANHLCSKHERPTVVLTLDHSGEILKGSCRAPNGFNVVDAFNAMGDIMLTAGGHAMAGGCSIRKEDFEIFKNKLQEFARNTPLKIEKREEIPISITDITFESYHIIESFSPFGENWPAPQFVVPKIRTASLNYTKTSEHIMTFIGQGVKLTGFYMPKEEVSKFKFVDLTGKFRTSLYRGYTSLEFLITNYKENID